MEGAPERRSSSPEREHIDRLVEEVWSNINNAQESVQEIVIENPERYQEPADVLHALATIYRRECENLAVAYRHGEGQIVDRETYRKEQNDMKHASFIQGVADLISRHAEFLGRGGLQGDNMYERLFPWLKLDELTVWAESLVMEGQKVAA